MFRKAINSQNLASDGLSFLSWNPFTPFFVMMTTLLFHCMPRINPRRFLSKVMRNRMNKKCALDFQAFFQILITFRIMADYEKDELLEILIPASTQKEAPDMCQSL